MKLRGSSGYITLTLLHHTLLLEMFTGLNFCQIRKYEYSISVLMVCKNK